MTCLRIHDDAVAEKVRESVLAVGAVSKIDLWKSTKPSAAGNELEQI